MTLLDVSIVNVALPSIKTGLHASSSDLQWVLSGYALTFGLVLVPAGRLGDAYGYRRMFMSGMAVFVLASAAAGLASGPTWLTVARLVQGAAGGLLNPQIAGIIQQLFTGRDRGRAFGALGAVIGLATAVGPLAGGLLIAAGGASGGWRWVFYVNIPIGVVAIPLARRLLPATTPEQQRSGARAPLPRELDPYGVLLLGLGVALVLVPLVEDQQWHSPLIWLMMPAAALVIWGFVLWERRFAARGKPVVDLGLFALRSYTLGLTVALVYFASFTAIFFIYVLYLQSGLAYSALLAGVAITPFAIGSGGAAMFGGRVVWRFGRTLIAFGLALVGIGLGAALLAAHLVPGRGVGWAMAAPLMVAGAGSGLVISPNQTLTLSEVPVERGGSAAGVLQTAQRVGSAVGIAVVGLVFFRTLSSSHADWAAAFQRGLTVAILLVVVTLLVALSDLVIGWRRNAVEHAR